MKFSRKLKFGGRAAVLLPVITVALISFAVYFNTLSNGFVYDDHPQVVENPWIRDTGNIFRIFTSNVWSFVEQSAVSNYYRPLMHTIYIVNYNLFGLRPWGFHLVNMLFHAANSVMVFLITATLMGKESKQYTVGSKQHEEIGKEYAAGSKQFSAYCLVPGAYFLSAPFLAALLFATHPIHTEAVTWIAAVPELSFTFFYLLSLYFYMKYREGSKGAYLLSVLSFALAAFCKEPALTLPVILIAYDYGFRKEGDRLFDRLKAYIPYIAVSAAYLAMRVYALGGFAPQKPHVSLSAYGYFINVFPLFAEYLEKLILPINLNAFHVLHPISSLLEAKGILSAAVTAAFVASSFFSKNRNNTVFFGSLLIVIPLLPALYIPALGENVFAERYLYLPSAGFIILGACGLAWAKARRPKLSTALSVAALLVIGLYSAGTISRNSVWKDNYTLFTDTIEKTPDANMIHYNLGNYYAKEGRLAEAAKEYQIAISLNPNYDRSHNNLGNIYKAYGRIDEAVAEYEAAVRINPYNAEVYNNLGVVYAYQGRGDEAVLAFKTALALNPDFVPARRNLEVVTRKRR
ncbi:MAG: tetratricopeptide repeat protein [Nitrospirae bacterium]|nr:tetratricopeptide repeat protein [Nitrospirota bacterium]